MCQLSNLEVLDLSKNMLWQLPDEVGRRAEGVRGWDNPTWVPQAIMAAAAAPAAEASAFVPLPHLSQRSPGCAHSQPLPSTADTRMHPHTPAQVSQLRRLRHLDVASNCLTALPAQLPPGLTYLDASNNSRVVRVCGVGVGVRVRRSF